MQAVGTASMSAKSNHIITKTATTTPITTRRIIIPRARPAEAPVERPDDLEESPGFVPVMVVVFCTVIVGKPARLNTPLFIPSYKERRNLYL